MKQITRISEGQPSTNFRAGSSLRGALRPERRLCALACATRFLLATCQKAKPGNQSLLLCGTYQTSRREHWRHSQLAGTSAPVMSSRCHHILVIDLRCNDGQLNPSKKNCMCNAWLFTNSSRSICCCSPCRERCPRINLINSIITSSLCSVKSIT